MSLMSREVDEITYLRPAALHDKRTAYTEITCTFDRQNIKGNKVTKRTTVVLFIDQFRTSTTDPLKIINKAVIPTENRKGEPDSLTAAFTCHSSPPIDHRLYASRAYQHLCLRQLKHGMRRSTLVLSLFYPSVLTGKIR